MALNHVSLTVRDRERSAAFYAEHFGLVDRVHEDDHLLILGGPDGGLLALSEGEPAAADLPRTNHFGFQLASVEEVYAARERLRAAGIAETEWQEQGIVRVQVADPDGYRVELFAY
jgi:catechol 2,3-dioxygenase-like lactoylglutathione lyase family enzyme